MGQSDNTCNFYASLAATENIRLERTLKTKHQANHKGARRKDKYRFGFGKAKASERFPLKTSVYHAQKRVLMSLSCSHHLLPANPIQIEIESLPDRQEIRSNEKQDAEQNQRRDQGKENQSRCSTRTESNQKQSRAEWRRPRGGDG